MPFWEGFFVLAHSYVFFDFCILFRKAGSKGAKAVLRIQSKLRLLAFSHSSAGSTFCKIERNVGFWTEGGRLRGRVFRLGLLFFLKEFANNALSISLFSDNVFEGLYF